MAEAWSFSSSWFADVVAYDRKDGWYRKAKREGYRSRAAYKLIELDKKLRLFRKGMRVVDLGCAPGGWLQVAAERVGRRGRVVGVDRLQTQPLASEQVKLLLGDVNQPGTRERLAELLGGTADLLLSDMAPNTSGVGFQDHVRSIELVRMAGELAAALLTCGGALLAKVFDGPDLDALLGELKDSFGPARRIRLKSTRKGSREIYLFIPRKEDKRNAD
ncbi:MAG TPA: RlmE family RNA methyltransferase [Myxococcota bacterium]|nr:RlmE family RNA methyltransferase [Myxococcota bacterium]